MQEYNLNNMNRLEKKYREEVISKMKDKFGYKSNMAVPRISKVVLNVGISATKNDDKYIDLVVNTLSRITGQKPVLTKAKESISSFKIREGNVVGAAVVIRRFRMYDFIDKFINLTLPNVRDFRGLNQKSVDKHGNLSIGLREHLCFPEINPDEVENIHGLEVCIVTSTNDREQGLELLTLMGIPFAK